MEKKSTAILTVRCNLGGGRIVEAGEPVELSPADLESMRKAGLVERLVEGGKTDGGSLPADDWAPSEDAIIAVSGPLADLNPKGADPRAVLIAVRGLAAQLGRKPHVKEAEDATGVALNADVRDLLHEMIADSLG